MKLRLAIVVGLSLAAVAGCTADAEPAASESDPLGAPFTPSPDDEAVDPSDPPTDPDPAGDDVEAPGVSSQSLHPLGGGGGAACPKWSKLSPRGLTLAIDIVDQAQLADLVDVARYIRARDVFVLRIDGFPRKALAERFPCNRVVSLVWPNETSRLGDMLQKNPAIDGAALDWEGGDQVGSVSQQLPRIENQVRRIKNHGLLPVVAPAGDRAQWMPLTRRGGFAWLFAQLQPACKNSAAAFAHGGKDLVKESIASGVGSRNVAYEISLDSSASATNHVDADRAAACTRAAYGKGVRGIYIYGKQRDHLRGYFEKLGAMGVRRPR